MNTESLSCLFKAFSEPVRLRIVHLLLVKEDTCVCDLVVAMGLSQSVISRHLAYLRHNNIVIAKREGVWMHYQLSTYARQELQVLLGFIENSIKDCEVITADLVNYSETNNC